MERLETELFEAAAKGSITSLKKLLKEDPLILDRVLVNIFSETPLHVAAMLGHIDFVKEIIRIKPQLASKPQFINSKDTGGNTILHLAVEDKQVETIKFLLSVPAAEVNALNLNGMTEVDVLIKSRRDVRDSEIEESLKLAGCFGTTETNVALHTYQNMASPLSPCPDHLISPTNMQRNSLRNLPIPQEDWLERKRSALMVVASLIATMAFQVGVNPPSGVWQDNNLVDSQGNPVSDPHRAGYSVMAHNYPKGYPRFYMINTTAFIASLSIILLLMSGLPIRRRFFMWILMVITWLAITAIALAYTVSIMVLTPSDEEKSVLSVVGYSVFVWLCLMALLLIGHTVRLIIKLVRKLRKTLGRRGMVAGSAVLVNNIGA
ncbi:UNVERIFIED_CONTAM: hypothetical protein Sangu_1612100 [Sesamum angustifolium]|uniref:PGG domain-containing protein n=1 Tax=Sesamum angustifolium TaxID=2727405 RepID=A0AAW2MJG9_9LAMI